MSQVYCISRRRVPMRAAPSCNSPAPRMCPAGVRNDGLATRCKENGHTCAEHMPWNGLQSHSGAQVNFLKWYGGWRRIANPSQQNTQISLNNRSLSMAAADLQTIKPSNQQSAISKPTNQQIIKSPQTEICNLPKQQICLSGTAVLSLERHVIA